MVETGELMTTIKAKRLSEASLRKEFSKNPKEYYSTKLFEMKGFVRQRCKVCGMNFWSLAETHDCGDTSHTAYSFFKEKPIGIGYSEFWKKFLAFFKKNKHEIIKRYPVVSRWRQDLYFTIAGIQDFQRIENNRMTFEYSANPLLVPQMVLRFKDIENAGVTGEHFTGFMMANQTAFNYPKEGYWRDRTIELNFEFLTKVLGLEEDSISYHEDVWSMPDFSGFGPCLESFSKGLELCNNVFTQFELTNKGVKELDNKAVDVGWGFERALWFYTGMSNAYESAFSSTLEKLKGELKRDMDTRLYRRFAKYAGELNRDEVKDYAEAEKRILQLTKISAQEYEREIKPVQAIYAILDHTRTLMFAIVDGSLPSNVGGGYNLRILLRRSFDFIEKYKLNISLPTLAEFIGKELKETYPELMTKQDIFSKVVDIERERYERSKVGARKAVEILLAKGEKIGKEQVRTLYESNGATPELIANVALSKGIKLDVEEGSYTEMVKGDTVKKENEEKTGISIPSGMKETKKLYYDLVYESKAKVIFARGKLFVLDKTPFYPEGGGEAADAGTVDGIKIVDVQSVGNVIVHIAEKSTGFKKGQIVDAKVDKEKRNAIMAHHTATHLISAAARRILGEHAWQEGAKKEAHKAHIDIAHYDKLSDENVRAIENTVNSWIFNGIKVSANEMSRGEAERKYGFKIYQGHGVPAKRMRIVVIRDENNELIDAEACGGLHVVGKESLLGMVNIIGTYRIHDGIDRIEFVAGPAALKRFEAMHDEINKVSNIINAEPLAIAKKVEEQQQELKTMHKIVEKNSERMADSIAESMPDEEFIEKELDVDRKMMIKIADLIIKRNHDCTVLLKNAEGYVICMSGSASDKSAIETLNSKLEGKRFSGGGSAKFAEGKLEKG
jgi:alanyl-tRNA synthetase